MLRMHCVSQTYEWGKRGTASAVAKLASSGEGKAVEAGVPYAEYWFGTHPAGHSKIHIGEEDVLLHDWLLRNPTALGVAPYSTMTALPYLLKVLSVAKALSIQAHPDKALAVRLHKDRPDLYRDDNHKPEMICALTPFEAMCGFRSPAEIAHNIEHIPELRALVGDSKVAAVTKAASGSSEEFKAALKDAFSALMSASEAQVMAQVTALDMRLSRGTHADLSPDSVAQKLLLQYPSDVGVFAPYLLNTVRLNPGEAIFLGANEPHAYIHGDGVEVMACSDNVVRAGLTPKFKDVPTLVEMLTYKTGKPEILGGEAIDAHTRQYNAPVPEFVLQHTLIDGDKEYTMPAAHSGAILVVVEGQTAATVSSHGKEHLALPDGCAIPPKRPTPGVLSARGGDTARASSGDVHQKLEEGQVWFQPAGTNVTLTVAAGKRVSIFRAFANATA